MDITSDLRDAAERMRVVLGAPDFSDAMLAGFYAKRSPDLTPDELAAHMRLVANELAKPFDE